MTIIKTKRLILRPMTLKDAQGYLECHADEEAKRNFMSIPKNLEEAKKEINENRNLLSFAIIFDGEFAGFANLELNKKPQYKHSAIIGYGLIKRFRGKGITTEAVKALTNYGFKKLKMVRISGMCRTFNKASAKVLKKAGYKLEGILRKNKFKDGKYLDDMLYAKVR